MSPTALEGDLSVHRRAPLAEGADAAPVLLVHGTMDRGAGMARVGRSLRDRTVVRYDRRGWGRSAALEPSDDLRVHAADLLSVAGDGPVEVIGHSMGAVIALVAASMRPEAITRIVAYEPPTPWEPWWPRSTPGNQAWRAGRHDTQGGDAAEAFVRSMIGVDAWDVLPEAQRRARRADGPALLADLAALAVPRPFDSTSIGTPVVLAHGTESGDWHIRATSDLAALLPTATLRTVEGAGHLAPTTHPDLVAGLLRA